jgi:hypothetical protein
VTEDGGDGSLLVVDGSRTRILDREPMFGHVTRGHRPSVAVAGMLVLRSLKKRRGGIYCALPVPHALL